MKDRIRELNVGAGGLVLATLLLVGMSTAAQAAQTAAGCTAAKYKAAGKCTAQTLKCYAVAAAKAVPVDAICLSDASLDLEIAFDRIEVKGGCATSDDSPAVLALIDAGVDELLAGLTCSDELKAAGKEALSQLKCYAKAKKKAVAVDDTCLTDAEADLVAAYGKSKCPAGGDDAAASSTKVSTLTRSIAGRCSGTAAAGACWFFSPAGGMSCDAVCAAQGLVCDEASTRDVIGSGAPDSSGCFVIAGALGLNPVNHETLHVCDGTSAEYGIGCYYRGDDGYYAHASTPVTTCAATGNIAGVCEANKQRICACE